MKRVGSATELADPKLAHIINTVPLMSINPIKELIGTERGHTQRLVASYTGGGGAAPSSLLSSFIIQQEWLTNTRNP